MSEAAFSIAVESLALFRGGARHEGAAGRGRRCQAGRGLRQAAGQAFYNTSTFTLRNLRARASRQQFRADFEAYLDGFSPNVQDILENLSMVIQNSPTPG